MVGPRRPLELIIPRGTRDDDVGRLLEQKRGWIEAKTTAARALAVRPSELGLERRGIVWLDGRGVSVVREGGRRSVAALKGDRLIVAGPDASAGSAVERWYRREARRRVSELVGREAERLGVEYRELAIRDSRTRWGSCSQRGTLSFSWRLLLAPGDVLEYVVVHELCHIRELNHRKAFWGLLEAAWPGWRRQEAWLREHGHELLSYRPAAALDDATRL